MSTFEVSSTPPVSESLSPNSQLPFRLLGFSLARRLISYLSPWDAGAFTASCKWLSDFRSFQTPNFLQYAVGDTQIRDCANPLLLNLRTRDVVATSEDSLRKDFIFDPQYTALFHVEQAKERLLFLSLYKTRVILWEIAMGKPRVRETFPGPTECVGYSVCDSAVVVMGESTLILSISQWKSETLSEKSSSEFVFPSAVSRGAVTLLWKWKLLATSRHVTVTVFSSDLHPLWEHTHGIKSLSVYFHLPNPVYIPSLTHPYLLHLFPSYFSIYDAQENRLITSKLLRFSMISHSGMMVVQGKSKEKSYLLVLGTVDSETKLYANGYVLTSRAKAFAIHGRRLLCLAANYEFLIYEADTERIVLLRSVGKSIAESDQIHLFSDLVISVAQKKTRIDNLTEDYSCAISYIQGNSVIHREKIAYRSIAKTFAFRGNLAFLGLSGNCNLPCVAVVHFFYDWKKGDLSLGEKFTEYQLKTEACYREKMDEKRKNEQFIREREAKVCKKKQAKEKKMEMERNLRVKTQKSHRDDLKVDLRQQIELLMRPKIPNNRQLSLF